MKKKLTGIFLFAIIFSKAQTPTSSVSPTDKELSRREQIKKQRRNILFSLSNIGVEVAQPIFRNEMAIQGFMHGPTIQYFGFMEAGFLKGTAIKKNNAVLSSQATMYYLGFKYNHILLRSRSLNFGPAFGMRFMLNELRDPLVDEASDATGTFGVGLYGGAFIKLGPVTFNAKMHLDGNINFSKGSSYNPLSIYPSFGIAFSPLEILLNPKEFSHTAMAHWVTDYKSTVSRSINYTQFGDKIETTRYTSTWKDNYGNQTMSCKDIQPFFFIGPRISTNITHFNKTSLLSAYGLNMGCRRGALFLNAFIEKANIHFNEPFTRNYDTSKIYNNSFKGRVDGEFVRSTKYGAQIGIELINWLQSKDFIYKESRVKRATAFTSIILFAGYGKSQLGELMFNSDSGKVSYDNYIIKNPAYANDETQNVLLTTKNKSFLSFGGQFGLGSIALNAEYTLYDKAYKKLNNWNVGLSYNLPVIRMMRALKAANLTRKINKLKAKKN